MGHSVTHRATSVLGSCLWLLAATPLAAQSVFQVKNINTTATGSANPMDLERVDGRFFLFEPATLFFAADDGVTGVELWKSDGTEPGTILVKDIAPGPASSNPSQLAGVPALTTAGRLFFIADDGVNGAELWISDGTSAGTRMVKDINGTHASSGLGNLTPFWRSPYGPRIFFTADDGASGVELWYSNGTPEGTYRVKDINPAGSSSPASLTFLPNVNVNVLFFSADDGVHGRELWRSDGTESRTVMARDIDAGPGGSNPSLLTRVEDALYFVAFTPVVGAELWRATVAGSLEMNDIRIGIASSSPTQLVAVGNSLFFQADDGVNGRELWKTNYTREIGMVADINPNGGAFVDNSLAGVVVSTERTLFFRADDGIHGEELWKSDGTALGTLLVKDIYPGTTGGMVHSLTNVNGVVFFGARNAQVEWGLWRTDGREAGTFHVTDVSPGPVDVAPNALTACEPFLYFSAGGVDGNELFATDLVFEDGFESGGTDVWSLASTDEGDLSVQAVAALHGDLGLSVLVDDRTSLFVLDESPKDERRYRARFRLDPNGFDPGESNGRFRVRVFLGMEEGDYRGIALILRRIGGQYSVMGKVGFDGDSGNRERVQTPFFDITDDPHTIELDWVWSPGGGPHIGRFTLWIDEVQVSTLSGLNTRELVQSVRLGAMSVKPGATGTLYFDNFESRRERYIGLEPE